MQVARALSIIADHGCDAYRTPEGLLCITSCCWSAEAIAAGRAPACEADDRFSDYETTIPVDSAGELDASAVMAWLGY